MTLSMGLLVGVGATVWLTPRSPLQETPAHVNSQQDRRLGQLEHAVTALTQALHGKQEQLEHAVTALMQALHGKQTKDVRPEPTRVAVPANDQASRQALAQLIRDEVRQAVADASPEAQRAREEASAEAAVLASPENRAAYQSAADVVQAAVAARRWTEEDKEEFRAAFGLLTNTQRMELMHILAPAINNGEVKVEVTGPLF